MKSYIFLQAFMGDIRCHMVMDAFYVFPCAPQVSTERFLVWFRPYNNFCKFCKYKFQKIYERTYTYTYCK